MEEFLALVIAQVMIAAFELVLRALMQTLRPAVTT